MRLSVFGTGYVGLVTAACFAELGNEVLACDVDGEKIKRLESGEVPFYEPGLPEVVLRNHKEGRLRFTTLAKEAVDFGEVIFVAVGTPPKNGDSIPDLQYVYAVAGAIGEHLVRQRTIVVMKSTVPVGTSLEAKRRIGEALAKRGIALEFAVVSNPEFLKEGNAIEDFMHPDRVVVGAEELWARDMMRDLYASIVEEGALLFMDTASAEMSKYASNTMLAARISLMNEFATMAEAFGADIRSVREVVASDQRIGKQFLAPGVGYGGSCFPKDVQALVAAARAAGLTPVMSEAIEKVNGDQKERFTNKILAALGDAKGKRVALWGLAFKPKTDDVRQAPSLRVIEGLLSRGVEVTAYDPAAVLTAKAVLGDSIDYADDMYEALKDKDALVIVTDWPQFLEPDFGRMAELLKQKLIIDGRNIYDPLKMREQGFRYISIGRP